MKNKFVTALVCFWLLAPLAFGAGWQGFLRLATISGGSADPDHPGWMDVQTATTAQISNLNGKPAGGDLHFQKFLDISSPALALACAKGTAIKSGTLDLADTNASLAVFLRLNLTNVIVTSVATASTGTGGTGPVEQFSLQSQIISWNYTRFNPASGLALTNVSALWNFDSETGGATNDTPVFMTTGIRKTTGVELDWNATANGEYRIYAVPDLTRPFLPIAVVTDAPGPATYVITPAAPAMFYVVEQVSTGY
jgi:type VI secretion system secreted protein Hcp